MEDGPSILVGTVEGTLVNAVLIGTERHRTRDALSEAWYVFSEHLGLSLKRRRCRIPGLAIIKVNLDVLEVMRKIKNFVLSNNPSFMACLTFTPLHKLFKLSQQDKSSTGDPDELSESLYPIVSSLKALIHLVNKNESWRVTVRKRHTSLSSQEIISYVVENLEIPGPVDLTNPQKIIRIEILGSDCGVSIHRPDDLVSLQKLGRIGSY